MKKNIYICTLKKTVFVYWHGKASHHKEQVFQRLQAATARHHCKKD